MKRYLIGGIMIFSLASAEYPLFDAYPTLSLSIARASFGVFPTPIQHLQKMGDYLGIPQLYTKREDLCGTATTMGGNKTRKLELLLPAAQKAGAKVVVTFGGLGSNHVAATACYAPSLGLSCVALLTTQPMTDEVCRNILLDSYYGAQLFMCPHDKVPMPVELDSFLKSKGITQPYTVIPMGGSNVLGVISQINAVFELKKQIEQGLLPEPDYLYAAFGSMGTAAGLIMGIKLAGLKTHVKAVRVASREKYTKQALFQLIHDTHTFLQQTDSSIPEISYEQGWDINDDFLGNGFAHTVPAGQEALTLFQEIEYLTLDTTYTAKAAAALCADACNDFLKSSDVVLYWHTFCATDFSALTNTIEYRQLPAEFHQYFTATQS